MQMRLSSTSKTTNPQQVRIAMSTGLNGTPMASFSDSLTPEQRWAITDYIVSLSGTDGPAYTNLVVAKYFRIRSI